MQDIFIERMEHNQDLFAKLMTDQHLAALIIRSLRCDVYDRILGADEASGGAATPL